MFVDNIFNLSPFPYHQRSLSSPSPPCSPTGSTHTHVSLRSTVGIIVPVSGLAACKHLCLILEATSAGGKAPCFGLTHLLLVGDPTPASPSPHEPHPLCPVLTTLPPPSPRSPPQLYKAHLCLYPPEGLFAVLWELKVETCPFSQSAGEKMRCHKVSGGRSKYGA